MIGFDLRERGDLGGRDAHSAEQAVKHGKGDVRVHFQHHAAFQRFRLEDVQNRHLRDGTDELVVRQLFHLHDVDLNERSELSGEVRGQITRKVFVDARQASQVILGKPDGALEIVHADFPLLLFPFQFFRIHFAGRQRCQQRVYLALRKNVNHCAFPPSDDGPFGQSEIRSAS